MAAPATGRESLAQSRQIDSLECQAGTGKPKMSATRPPPRSSGRPRQHAKVRLKLLSRSRRLPAAAGAAARTGAGRASLVSNSDYQPGSSRRVQSRLPVGKDVAQVVHEVAGET